MSATDKIAREILTGETGDFDLANYDTAQVDTLCREAFAAPIACSEMMRCTFVIGGGKKVRQKYGASLGKDLAAALQSHGFNEDKGAALAIECAGTYKRQHNTDTDLISVHVYPFVNIAGADGGDDEEGEGGAAAAPAALADDKVAVVVGQATEDFEQTVRLKVKSFGQKRKLREALKGIEKQVTTLETKLVNMEALTPSEDALYNSAVDLASKIEWLSKQIQTMITDGKLTVRERQVVVAQFQSKIEQIATQKASADEGGKKWTKLDAAGKKMKEQLDALAAEPAIKRQVEHAREIAELKQRLGQLDAKMDAGTATLDQMTEAGRFRSRVDDLKEAQEDLYWFEDTDLIEIVKAPAAKKKAAKSKTAATTGNGGGVVWSTVGKSKGGSKPKSGGAKGGGNGFAGLFVE